MIDDGSTDDTIDYAIELRDRLGDGFWYARNEKNMGVHYSWNVGLRVAFSQPAEYIAIINNDLLFTKDWDIPLIKALETKKLVSPYHTTGEVPADWPIGSQRMPNEVLIEILGACFMAKTETFREVGFFPEQMRYYYGDNWIVEKVKPENCAQIQESYVHHYCGKTTNQLGVAEWLQKDHEEYEKL
jgi:GT2 family glycosyltransferase